MTVLCCGRIGVEDQSFGTVMSLNFLLSMFRTRIQYCTLNAYFSTVMS